MCGNAPVATSMVDALKRLEYRGYDSAGVATLEAGHLTRRRAEGKLRTAAPWKAGLRDSRPGRRVHNGIIENFAELRTELESRGAKWTETDTEVVAHLVTDEMLKGAGPITAVASALPRLRGAFALAFLFSGEEDLLVGARRGSPLAVGYGDGEMYLGSDAIALAPFTSSISSRLPVFRRGGSPGRRKARLAARLWRRGDVS
jgi:glutamine---fructose-6-phosphate transaminase (isomerizing)